MNVFSQNKRTKVKKSTFNLSHEHKLTCEMGYLIPHLLLETLPGDKFKINTEVFLRFTALLAPIFHRVNVFTHFFYVPTRIIWKDFEKFITGGITGNEVVPYPKFNPYNLANPGMAEFAWQGSLMDYLGCPVATDNSDPINAIRNIWNSTDQISELPFRAYQKIYNDFYRDQNLIPDMDPQIISLEELLTLRRRSWEHDYFTSALPWAQRGGEVNIPGVGAQGKLTRIDEFAEDQWNQVDGNQKLPFNGGSVSAYGHPAPNNYSGRLQASNMLNSGLQMDLSNIKIDDDGSGLSTINNLRRAIKLQEWLEKNMRGGARYIEQILAHFGVVSSDARLQRPEYLGGSKAPVQISEVVQTAPMTNLPDSTPLATLAGQAVGVGSNKPIVKYCEEHGYIIGIMSIMPKPTYMQGLPQMFGRFDRFDYAWPEFAHLGEQYVFQWELKKEANQPEDATFGYQQRYADYKYEKSRVSGFFRSYMDHWHLARKFEDAPLLNKSFIECKPDDRIFATEGPWNSDILVMAYNNVLAKRPLPKYSTPRIF